MSRKTAATTEAKKKQAGPGIPVGMTFADDEIAALDREASALGMGRATLIRFLVRRRYGFANPISDTPVTGGAK